MITYPISFSQTIPQGKSIKQIREQAKQIPHPDALEFFDWCVDTNTSACIKSGVPGLIKIAQKKSSFKEPIKNIFLELVNSPDITKSPASPTWLREFNKALDILG